MTRIRLAFSLLLLIGLASRVPGDARLEGIACRSVHLAYSAPPGAASTPR